MAGRLPSVSGISQTSEPGGDAPRRPSLLSGGGGSELDPLEVQAGRQAVMGGGNLHGMAKLNRPHFTPQVRVWVVGVRRLGHSCVLTPRVARPFFWRKLNFLRLSLL
jgi:hypothetical protein